VDKQALLGVLGRLTLLVAVVAIAVPGKTAKIILLAVLLIAGGVMTILLARRNKPKTAPPPSNPFTPEEVDRLLEQYGADDPPAAKLEKLVRAKSKSTLYRHGKVVVGDAVVFDATVCRSKNYQGKRYYRVSAEETALAKAYYIMDDPSDRAVYLFSLNPDDRAFTEEVETTPQDDVFHPWKAFESLDDYVGNMIPKE